MKFFVDEGAVEKQVTAGALKAVHEICTWLYDPPTLNSLEPTYRYAQSIITRSEAEVFGLSSPRFAVRMRLANGSFFNLRRLSLLASRASLEYAERISRLFSCINRQRPAKVMARALIDPCTAIADSLLQVPTQRFGGSYEILKADIGGYYGETDCKPGVPYLQHIELGGGFCAQAVCFMVMLHYHKRVNGIGGIPEITHAARNIGSGTVATELQMSGLSDQQVSAFFRLSATGLRCHREMFEKDSRTNWDFEKRAIRSYLRSNVPIILPLSLKKMWQGANGRNSILLANRVFQRISKYQMSPVLDDRENHFVLLGGINKHGTQYVLHDPATVPFLQCSFDDLLTSRRDCGTHHGELDRFRIFPVVPCEVRSSLLDTPRNESEDGIGGDSLNPGLMRTVQRLQTRGEIVINGLHLQPYQNKVYSPGDFLLIKLTDNDAGTRLRQFLEDNRLAELVENAITAENLCDHWVWLQRIDSPSFDPDPEPRLWLWDAEVALSRSGQISDYLVAIINVVSGTTQRLPRARIAGIAPPPRRQSVLHFTPHTDVSHLKPALMSSYAVSASNPSEEEIRPADAASMFRCIWNNAIGDGHNHQARCELYVMMEPEIRYWQRIWRNAAANGNGLQVDRRILKADCAIDFLAAINKTHCVEIAKEIASCFKANDIDIVAIATYLPEIARRYGSPSAEKFVRAMANIGRIARALRGADHPVRAIELVGGSRVAGPCVKPKWGSQPTQYSVRIETASDCINNLLRNLDELIRDGDSPFHELPLCFELEPGEFFVLNSLERIQQLVKLLKQNTSLSQLVGFNVDVSHWRLSGVNLSDVSPPEPGESDLCSRVYNSHLSGHHPCAHIADIEPLNCAGMADYAVWNRFLKSCAGLPQRPGNANGSVSLELEAVDCTETVEVALRQLFHILA